MHARLRSLVPFPTPETRRLALLFAIVYFAQGMWYLPNQVVKAVLNDQRFTAGQIGTFFLVVTMAWNIKPVYGLISDFVPLFGRRRKSYFLLTTSLAAAAGLALAAMDSPSYVWVAAGMATMGLGLAFTDVLTDALMVESGRAHRLTGAFQSVQWAAIGASTVLGGFAGGLLAEGRRLNAAFLLAAAFPFVSLFLAATFIREARAARTRGALTETWSAIRTATRDQNLWVVAAFIFFWAFSPSFGAALFTYQTNVLKLSQSWIGTLDSITAVTGIVGAAVYAPLSRRFSLKRLIVWAIEVAAVGTLAFLLYRDLVSAIAIHAVFGFIAQATLLAFLDLAARACPRRVEATFFSLLMSVYNIGMSVSDATGGYLYDWLGYQPLVVISAAMTGLAIVFVPLVKIDRIEAHARAAADTPDPG